MSILAPVAMPPPDDAQNTIVSEQVSNIMATINECQSYQEAIALCEHELADFRNRLASSLDLLRTQARRIPGATQEQKASALVSAAVSMGALTDIARLTIWRALVPTDVEFSAGRDWQGPPPPRAA